MAGVGPGWAKLSAAGPMDEAIGCMDDCFSCNEVGDTVTVT